MESIELDEDNRSAYEQNKKEMFEGMRAYHVSEHQHKRDAINFLKTILTITVGIFVAIIGAIFSSKLNSEYMIFLIWFVVVFVTVVTILVVKSTNSKIEADNKIYKKFGAEYTRFCQILRLDKPVVVGTANIQAKILDPNRPIGEGNGYKKTMDIISSVGMSIVMTSITLAGITSFLNSYNNS